MTILGIDVSPIDGWFKKLFTLASNRVSWVASALFAYFSANPKQLEAIMSHLPWWMPIVIGLGSMLVMGGARSIKFGA